MLSTGLYCIGMFALYKIHAQAAFVFYGYLAPVAAGKAVFHHLVGAFRNVYFIGLAALLHPRGGIHSIAPYIVGKLLYTHYANGVESEEQELMVRSNKNFSIGVKSNVTNFTYTGTTTPAPVMPVNGVLGLKVTENNTGGSIASPFSSANYASLTSSNQNLITGSSRGGNKTFSIQYKATPGFAYPAGTYSADVVYTATQQ